MKYYNFHLVGDKDDALIERHIGKYGEDLVFSKRPDGTYNFSSIVLNMDDIYLADEGSKIRVINAYCAKGVDDFRCGPGYHNQKYDRFMNLGQVMWDLYQEYVATKEEECLLLIKDIIINVERFKLPKTEYIDAFITFGSEEHWDYIRYILKLRKEVLKTTIYRWRVLASDKNDRGGIYCSRGNNIKEARKFIKRKIKGKHYIKFEYINQGPKKPSWDILDSSGELIKVSAWTKGIAENMVKFHCGSYSNKEHLTL